MIASGGGNGTLPIGVSTSIHHDGIWEPRERDLKTYIHFDRNIPVQELKRIARDPAAVAENAFFPLLLFHEKWVKFRKENEKRKIKSRPIRYACRKDALIFAAYRAKLAPLYEEELRKRDLSEVPVAYRRLPKPGGGFKSNIEIARDVFSEINHLGECDVTVVDIKSYFESLDHERILRQWENLLGGDLPRDHLSVYKAVTKYSVVDLEELFSRLSMYEKGHGNNRIEKRRRKIDGLRHARCKQICSPSEFRQIVVGKGLKGGSLIQKNGFNFGIPQGTPLSDLIANFYLIDFDQEINSWVSALGGIYRRYSDDIVIVLPAVSGRPATIAKDRLQSEIKKHGDQLRVQDKKVAICEFRKLGSQVIFKNVFGKASRNGLEYLGFEYDGTVVRIKNSTLSNAWRKLKRKAYGDAWRFVKMNRAKGRVWLDANYNKSSLEKKFLQNVTFSQDVGFDVWTFTKYVHRASKSFSGFNRIFSQQTKRYRRHTKFVIDRAYEKALSLHFK